MLTNVRYILLTALRDWLFAALFVGIILCALVAHMLGGTALIENQEMTIAFTAASARIVIIMGLIVFTCFHVRNAFDTKEIDVFLSRPITRSSLLLSYWFGFATVAFLLVIPSIGLVAAEGLLSKQGFAVWAISFLIECWLVVALALCAAFILKSAVTSVLTSMGFYVLARMIGFFIAASLSSDRPDSNVLANTIIKAIALIMPRLDLFAKSGWLIYGAKQSHELSLFLTQGTIFIPLFILITMLGFKRKQF